MIPEAFATASLWTATVIWNLIALLAFADAIRELVADRAEMVLAKAVAGNGRRIVARYRLRRAFWFVLAFGATLAIGALAFAALVYFPPAQQDTRLSTAILRILFLFNIFAFWRAKRSDRAMRRELEG